MKQQFEELNTKYQAISQREKVMVLVAGMVVVLFVGFFNILEPLWISNSELGQNRVALQQELKDLAREKDTYQQHLGTDPNLKLHQSMKKLTQSLQQLETKVDSQVVDLVKPENMPEVIRNLLQQMQGVKVESLVANKPKALIKANAADKDIGEQVNLYRHGISLKVSGNYRNLYRFLAKAETLPWKFHWNDFELHMVEYPTAELTIDIYTLSLESGFIGL